MIAKKLKMMNKWRKRHLSLMRFIFARHRRNPIVRVASRLARNIVKLNNNEDVYMHRNGETWLMSQIASYFSDRSTVFDVGANVGEWVVEFGKRSPSAKIYAFELVQSNFMLLQEAVGNLENVTVEPVGLSDAFGSVDVYLNNGISVSSLFQRVDLNESEKTTGTVMPGDKYIEREKISQINYMKIDVEGAEHLVLAGFRKALEEGKIDAICFEYGEFNIASRSFLRDNYEMLGEYNYEIGRLFPTWVEFAPWNKKLEVFNKGNYVAIRKELGDLIRKLS